MIAFFWLVAVEGLVALVVLALFPSDVENRIWLIYSAPRLAMMLAALVGVIVSIAAVGFIPRLRRRRPQALARLVGFLRQPPVSLGFWVVLLGMVCLVLGGSLALPAGRTGIWLRRALPLSSWVCLAALESPRMHGRWGAARPRQVGRWLLDGLEALARRVEAWLVFPVVPLAGAVICAALLLGRLAARSDYPSGYAGLFTLMSELIASNGFRLPARVPFYGPGGLPFAYPPLGLYLMALVTGVLRMPEVLYLRFAPLVFTVLAMIPLYGAVRILRVSGSALPGGEEPLAGPASWNSTLANSAPNITAALGALLAALSPRLFMAQGEAAGVTRALGFLFCMCAFYSALRLVRRDSRSQIWICLAALSVALTILSHLNYLAFVVVVFAALALSGAGSSSPFWKRFGLLLAAGLGGILMAFPWWGTLLSRYGADVILNAAFSHGNFSVSSVGDLLQHSVDSLAPLYRTPILAAGLVLGSLYHLTTRRWFYPLAVAGVLALSLGDWLAAPFAAAMAGEILVELARLVRARTKEYSGRFRTLPAAVFLLLALAAACYNSTRQIESISPVIAESTQTAAGWLREHTPDPARYLFFTASADEAEWFPWLARRTPAAGSWGAEWNGDFGDQLNSLNEVSACASRPSQSCVDGLLQRLDPAVLIASRQRVDPSLLPVLSGLAGWKLVYENTDYIVWERP